MGFWAKKKKKKKKKKEKKSEQTERLFRNFAEKPIMIIYYAHVPIVAIWLNKPQ